MQWFEDWFNTPYYHILYGHRDDIEARAFLSRLISYLKIEPGSRVLDLACGKGRHSKFLFEQGLNVLGLDLSENNIKDASLHATDGLDFIVHDMRLALPNKTFNLVLNLFTSFGYFDDPKDDLAVLSSVYSMLLEGGVFVLDYLNPALLPTGSTKKEQKIIQGIEFYIEKEFEEDRITKKISVIDKGIRREYEEKVKRYSPQDFKDLFYSVGFGIVEAFGSYSLEQFHASSSERMIIIAEKHG